MSNRENPCAGHLIEAAKLSVFIPDDRRPAFDNALREHDFEEAVKLLDQAIPDGVACPSAIFVLSDTDTGDGDLEEGVPYAYFDEEDLYERREKSGLMQLREKIGEVPTAHSWRTPWSSRQARRLSNPCAKSPRFHMTAFSPPACTSSLQPQ